MLNQTKIGLLPHGIPFSAKLQSQFGLIHHDLEKTYLCVADFRSSFGHITVFDQTHKYDDFFRFQTVFSDFTGQCFDHDESCRKLRYKQL